MKPPDKAEMMQKDYIMFTGYIIENRREMCYNMFCIVMVKIAEKKRMTCNYNCLLELLIYKRITETKMQ